MTWENFSVLLEQLFLMLGGMAVFMTGMKIMSHSLEQAAGSKMRGLMSKISNNRLAGVGIGAAVTALMNSSAATTVMLVGFVNVGVLSLAQATAIIMGANIGTTVSAQIFAFTGEGVGLSATGIFALVAMVGLILTMVAKKDRVTQIGNIMIGIGFIFIGLKFLSSAVSQLVNNEFWGEKIKDIFIAIGGGDQFAVWQMLLLFLLGVTLTAVMQSSAAMTGLVISLAGNGLISINMAIFITLGSNIGTCFTSIIASVGTSVNARRTAFIHLAFNAIGCILFIIPLFFVQEYVSDFLLKISSFGAETVDETVVQHAIANFHLFFNVVTTLVLLPFVNLLVKLASKVVPEKSNGIVRGKKSALHYLDPRLLEAPPIAVTQVRKEIVGMANMAFLNYRRSLKMLTEGDFSEQQEFDETERQINQLNKEITSYCIQLSAKELSDTDEKKISAFFHNVSDLERIGDYAQNITEYAARMQEDGGSFSEAAIEEIKAVDKNVDEVFNNMIGCLARRDLSLLPAVNEAEEEVDRLTNVMQEAHIGRMNDGVCMPESGAIYLQLAGNIERIADHMVNVAKSVKSYTKPIVNN